MLTMKKLMMATTAIVISGGLAAAADTTVQTDTDLGAKAQVQTGNGATTEVEGGASVSGEASTGANDDAMTQDTDTDAGADVDAAMLDEEALIGASVYDAKDVRVGEISEVESDADGKIASVVIDVGGFLGLGEKPVQIMFEDLTFEEKTNADAGASADTAGSAADAAGAAETALGTPGAEAEGMLEYRIHVSMTKEEMKQLPEYQG